MSRTVLTALAAAPLALLAVPTGPAGGASGEYPRGPVTVRPECFEVPKRDHGGHFGYGAGGSGGSLRSMPQKRRAPAGAAPSVAAPAPAPSRAPADGVATGAFDDPTVESFDMAEEAESIAEAEPARTEIRPRPSQGPALDWGATVHLSNDDSMSLASAQRVLYSAMNGMRIPMSEIRPHELLNYFSFDTATPDGDQVFDVHASAEQSGDQITMALSVRGAVPPRQPLDLTLLVDRSCSMDAEGRMDYTKRGLRLLSEQLERGDRVDVVLFDDDVCAPLENFVVGRDDPRLLDDTIRRMVPQGSTDLDAGLRRAYQIAQSHVDVRGRNRRVMVLTDALLNTGDVDPNTVSEVGRAFERDRIRVTGVGVGREFNDEMLDKLTEKGKGAYVYLGSEAVVDRVFGPAGFASLVQTIAHDVRFALHLPDSLAMERFYGEEASTDPRDVLPINYFAGTNQLFLQDLRMRSTRPVAADPVELEIRYEDAETGRSERRLFRTTVGKMLGSDPHNVRKGQALMAWTDLLMADSLGGGACGAPLRTYAERAARVPEDAEIAFVNDLVSKRCGGFEVPERPAPAREVSYRVRVDSDTPISAVRLECGGRTSSEALSGSDQVARLTGAPGRCSLVLSGPVDLTARVEVPSTDASVTCRVRGGRLDCR